MNQNESNIYPGQWGNVSQQYPASSGSYSPTSYQNDVGHGLILNPQGIAGYEGVNNTRPDDAPGYHSTTDIFSSDTPSNAIRTGYPSLTPGPLHQPHYSSRSGHSHSHSHSHSRSHQQVRPFAHHQPQSPSHHPQSRPRSHSQTRPHISLETPLVIVPQHPPPYYPAEVPLAQPINSSTQYPASPSRPFACDLCALSFNRQHDLKRHRETHTGEKPYLCNGGCGKTFTRKDALKRHQLVKACGKVDDAWP